MKKKIALFVDDINHLNRLKNLYSSYFDYYEVVPVYACDLLQGQGINKITFDEFRTIQDFKEAE